MSIYLSLSEQYKIESANYITLINPTLHPSRILDCHDFLYMLDGSWSIRENDTVYSLQSGDLLLLSAHRKHYGVSPCSAGNRHMYVHLFPSAAETFPDTPAFSAEMSDEADGCLTNFQQLFHCQHNPRIREIISEIIEVSWNDCTVREIHISALITALLCELFHLQENILPEVSDLVREITAKLRRSPQTFFSGSEIARSHLICERTLNNHFKRVYGMTFAQYQMTSKLEGIRHYLLAHPDAKLADVAQNYGFCDEYHLGRAYKNKYGISPKRHCTISSANKED